MLHLLSVDHRTHGLDLVARLGGVTVRLGPDLLAALPELRGVVVVATCNRLALLLDASEGDHSRPKLGSSRPRLDERVADFLARRADLRAGEPTLASWTGRRALAQLFATACGLESMVVGEREIAGQLRRAMILAHEEGTLTGALARAVEHASAVSRRVATATELSGTGRSVVAVGLDLAGRHLPALGGARVLIMGTGAYAGATVTALRQRGARQVEVHSRSNRAQAFADGRGLRAVGQADLPRALAAADLVITCRGLGAPVLTRGLLEPAVRLRRPAGSPAHAVAGSAGHGAAGPAGPAVGAAVTASAVRTAVAGGAGRTGPSRRPLVVLDLAVSRDVEAAVADLPGVVLIDLAAVQRAVPEVDAAQETAARRLVDREVQSFERLMGARSMDPVICRLRDQVELLVDQEIERLAPRGGVVDAEDAARALRRLAARLLHHPTVAARRAGEDGRDREYLDALPLLLGEEIATALAAAAPAPPACPVHMPEPAAEGPTGALAPPPGGRVPDPARPRPCHHAHQPEDVHA